MGQKRMTFGAIMAAGKFPIIELIDGAHVRVEGYGQGVESGRYWLQYAEIGGRFWNRIEDIDPSTELTIVPEFWYP